MNCREPALFGEAKEFVFIFNRCRIMRSAAAVSFYLTLSFFPFLICLHFLAVSVGIDIIDLENIKNLAVIPKPAVSGIIDYINYIRKLQSPELLFFAATILAASLSAAVRSFSSALEEVYAAERFKGAAQFIFSFVFSLVFLFLTYLFMLFCVAAKAVISLIDENIGSHFYIITKFEWLSLAALFVFLTLILLFVYRGFFFKTNFKESSAFSDVCFFCSALVSAVLVILSIIFSEIMEISIKYPLVYGSLSFIIIIMIWMYLCAVIILGGSVLLKVLLERDSAERKSYRCFKKKYR